MVSFMWNEKAPTFLLTCLFLCLPVWQKVEAQVGKKPANEHTVVFEDRVAFYLNQESREFFTEMARREKVLLQMVENLYLEVQARGRKAAGVGKVVDDELNTDAGRLVRDYTLELKRLTSLQNDIELLRTACTEHDVPALLDSLDALQRRIFLVLEDRQLFRISGYPRHVLVDLSKAYNREVDNLLNIYDILSRIEGEQTGHKIGSLRDEILQEKHRLEQFFSDVGVAPPAALVESYADEAEKVETILREMDELIVIARDRYPETQAELADLKQRFVQGLDREFAALVGVRLPQRGLSVFEVFKEWQARELAEYQVHFVRHQILKRDLLLQGTMRQRAGMLKRDLQDALSAYASGNYDLAERQLNAIVRDFASYYENLDSVHFFLGESYFARNLHDSAAAEFKQVVAANREAQYVGKSLFRLIQISQSRADLAAFDAYYDLFSVIGRRLEATLYLKGVFLAGYVYLRAHRFVDAARAFAAIPRQTGHYLAARFLLGIALLNLNHPDKAADIFRDLADANYLPWTDPQVAFFKNHARLKLGLMAYERGEYQQALRHLEKTSTGFTARDQSLISAAWAHFNLHDYAAASAQTQTLLRAHLDSENIYEASVLSAQCRRQLGYDGAALDDLRYVVNAEKVFATSALYNAERRKLVQQLNILAALERKAVQQQDRKAYAQVALNRQRLSEALEQFEYRGNTGNTVLAQFGRERETVLQQIEQLDELIVQANLAGRKTVRDQAVHQRQRLLKALDEYQSDVRIQNRHFFVDYPQAVSEVISKYDAEIVAELQRELELEKNKLLAMQRALAALRATPGATPANMAPFGQIERLTAILHRLNRKNERLASWISTRPGPTDESNFDTWANLAGLGSSDITFQKIQDRGDLIAHLALRLEFVNKVIERRKRFLEQKLFEYDELIRETEYDINLDKFNQEKQQREEYFKDSYFDVEEFERTQNESAAGPE